MDKKKLTPYLRRRCLDLDISERLALIRAIQGSLVTSDQHDWLEEKERILRGICGLDIRNPRRQKAYVAARCVFSFCAKMQGISQNTIGDFLGQNHASVHYQQKKMADAFEMPAQYPDYIALYNQFSSVIL